MATQLKLTAHRQRVLNKINGSGATRKSPLRLHGTEFKAAMWLYEHDFIGLVGSMFYPLSTKQRAKAIARLLVADKSKAPLVDALLLPSAAVAFDRGDLPEDIMKQLHEHDLWVLRDGSDGRGYYETWLGFHVASELDHQS